MWSPVDLKANETAARTGSVRPTVNQSRKLQRFESSTRHTSHNGPVTCTDRVIGPFCAYGRVRPSGGRLCRIRAESSGR